MPTLFSETLDTISGTSGIIFGSSSKLTGILGRSVGISETISATLGIISGASGTISEIAVKKKIQWVGKQQTK